MNISTLCILLYFETTRRFLEGEKGSTCPECLFGKEKKRGNEKPKSNTQRILHMAGRVFISHISYSLRRKREITWMCFVVCASLLSFQLLFLMFVIFSWNEMERKGVRKSKWKGKTGKRRRDMCGSFFCFHLHFSCLSPWCLD